MTDQQAEWEDLTQKEILIGCLTELQQIRMALEADEPEQEPQVLCTRCGWDGPESLKESHAKERHKAPPDIANGMFEPL